MEFLIFKCWLNGLFFGPSLSYIWASFASFVMWASASWIRGSDLAILTFVPENHDVVCMYVFQSLKYKVNQG